MAEIPINPPLHVSPKSGILWRSYEDTVALINQKARPVLAFVLDPEEINWIFLREILTAMPRNEKLRELLNGPCIAMFLKADSMPEYMSERGAGSSYKLAILSPMGLTPLAVVNYVSGKPEVIIDEIAKALEGLACIWS